MERIVERDAFVQIMSALVFIVGLGVFGWGLIGGRHGRRGVLRRSAGTLGRAEGWRTMIVGLTLTVLGLGGILGERWIVFMAIGFGIVEFIEASAILAAWHHGQRRKAGLRTSRTPTP